MGRKMVVQNFVKLPDIKIREFSEWKTANKLKARELGEATGVTVRCIQDYLSKDPESILDTRFARSFLLFAILNGLDGLPGMPKIISEETVRKMCESFLAIQTGRGERTIADAHVIARGRRMCKKWLPEGRRYPHKAAVPGEKPEMGEAEDVKVEADTASV